MLIFGLHSTFDDQPGWSMDSKPIHHPSPAKIKMLIFGLTFSFWWSAGLVIELKPHLPPLSSQKNKMLIFGLHLNSDDWPGRSMDSNPIHHPSPVKKKLNAWLQPHLPPSPAKKIKCSFLDYVELLMIGRAGQWTQTLSATPLQPK